MVYEQGTGNNRLDSFLDCWNILYDLSLLASRPSSDQELTFKLQMIHEMYAEKFRDHWGLINKDGTSND